jgi:hypothetical protein
MLDSIKLALWGFIRDIADDIIRNIIITQKDEIVKELTDEINSTDSYWVKFRNAIYLSLIEKVVAEQENA